MGRSCSAARAETSAVNPSTPAAPRARLSVASARASRGDVSTSWRAWLAMVCATRTSAVRALSEARMDDCHAINDATMATTVIDPRTATAERRIRRDASPVAFVLGELVDAPGVGRGDERSTGRGDQVGMVVGPVDGAGERGAPEEQVDVTVGVVPLGGRSVETLSLTKRVRLSSTHPRSRGHDRSSASWAISTLLSPTVSKRSSASSEMIDRAVASDPPPIAWFQPTRRRVCHRFRHRG